MIYESIKDRLVNSLSQIKSWFRALECRNKWGKQEPDTKKMKLIYEDSFKKLDTNFWRIGQQWGRFHIGNPTQYYGDESVYCDSAGLVLDSKWLPKKDMTTWENDLKYDINWSVGLISSYQGFEYGFYEFFIKLPEGPGLWPAVWLSAIDTWPPEIDILEAYSDEDGEWGSRLQTNLHFDFNPNKKNSGPRNHKVSIAEDMIKVSCHWTEDFIKIYYNGFLVRSITSKKTLKWFKGKKMIVILNNALRREYIQYMNKNTVTKFRVYKFKYWN